MKLALKQIKGLMIDRKSPCKPLGVRKLDTAQRSYNEAIDQISSRSITITCDRERLAKCIYDDYWSSVKSHVPYFFHIPEGQKEVFYKQADALIASQEQWLRVEYKAEKE